MKDAEEGDEFKQAAFTIMFARGFETTVGQIDALLLSVILFLRFSSLDSWGWSVPQARFAYLEVAVQTRLQTRTRLLCRLRVSSASRVLNSPCLLL